MSEEEITERIKDLIHTCDFGIQQYGTYDDLFELDKTALEGILDLYNKEKEKNRELQKYEEAYKLLSYGLNNYISKDRIKAEMEDIIDYFEYVNATSEDIEFLEKKKKELLEEEQ